MFVQMTEARKQPEQRTDFVVRHSTLYQEFLAEREEILRHKWLESERLGHDIGFERALLDWIRKHRDNWRRSRRQPLPKDPPLERKGGSDLVSKSPSQS